MKLRATMRSSAAVPSGPSSSGIGGAIFGLIVLVVAI